MCHVTIETSRILELFGTEKPNDKRNAFLYAVERVLLELNYKEKREKHDTDMYLLLEALRYTLSETTFREFD